MLKQIIFFISGFGFSKYLLKKKHWYIKEKNQHVKLSCSDMLSYLYKDYLITTEKENYEVFDLIIDFRERKIKINNVWEPLHYK